MTWATSGANPPFGVLLPKAPGDCCQSSAQSRILPKMTSRSDLGLFVSRLVASSLKSTRSKNWRFRRATRKSLTHSANRTYANSSTRCHQKFAPVLFDERWLPVPKHVHIFNERIGGAAKAVPPFTYRREERAPASTSVDRALHAVSGSESAESLPGVNRRVVFRP